MWHSTSSSNSILAWELPYATGAGREKQKESKFQRKQIFSSTTKNTRNFQNKVIYHVFSKTFYDSSMPQTRVEIFLNNFFLQLHFNCNVFWSLNIKIQTNNVPFPLRDKQINKEQCQIHTVI